MKDSFLIGASYLDIPTPALVVDSEKLGRNMDKMVKFVSAKRRALRPHAKTHKTPMIAHLQMRAGAVGICCATVGEAETMVYSGIPNVLIANEVVGADKIQRVISMAHYAEMMVAVDSMENLKQLSSAAKAGDTKLGVLVDIDVGMGRCGVRTAGDALKLAEASCSMEGIVFRGLMGYEGHAVFISDKHQREEAAQKSYRALTEIRDKMEQKGIPVETVSGAGTGTFEEAAESDVMTEIQAGSYIFMDGTYQKLALPFEQSLTVLSTVLSLPDRGTVILDAGMKAISVERECPTIQNMSDLIVKKLSEEHSTAYNNSTIQDIKPGTKINLIPSHCCTTVNLYDRIYVVKNGKVEAIWPVAARGSF